MVDKLKPKQKGLRQRMAKAETLTELNTLAKEAAGYKDASPHTFRRYVNTYKRREKELSL